MRQIRRKVNTEISEKESKDFDKNDRKENYQTKLQKKEDLLDTFDSFLIECFQQGKAFFEQSLKILLK